MTYLPGISMPIPANAAYSSSGGIGLTPGEFPMVYTTDGPIQVTNGLVFTVDSLNFNPGAVESGTFDCGTFSTPA